MKKNRRKNKDKKVIIISISIIVLICLAIIVLCPKIKLVGDKKVKIVYGTEYS